MYTYIYIKMADVYLFSTRLLGVSHRSDYYGINNTRPSGSSSHFNMQTRRVITDGSGAPQQKIYTGIHFFGGQLKGLPARDRDIKRGGLASSLNWIYVLKALVDQYNRHNGTSYGIVKEGQTHIIQAPLFQIFQDGEIRNDLANIYSVTGAGGADIAAHHVAVALNNGFDYSHAEFVYDVSKKWWYLHVSNGIPQCRCAAETRGRLKVLSNPSAQRESNRKVPDLAVAGRRRLHAQVAATQRVRRQSAVAARRHNGGARTYRRKRKRTRRTRRTRRPRRRRN